MSRPKTGSIVPIAEDPTSFHSHNFAERIDITEVFASHALRQNDRLRLGENAGRIALKKGQPDHLKEIRVDDDNSFQKLTVANRYRHRLWKQVGRRLYFWDFLLHRTQHGKGGGGKCPGR